MVWVRLQAPGRGSGLLQEVVSLAVEEVGGTSGQEGLAERWATHGARLGASLMSQAPTSNSTITSDVTQTERARVIKETNTRVAYARVVDPQPQGRWAKSGQSQDPATWYPHLPSNNPWSSDPVPNEEPLGYCIDQMDPIGDTFEVNPPSIAMPCAPLMAADPITARGQPTATDSGPEASSPMVSGSSPSFLRRRFT
jgi:hypothetical protein